MVHAGRVSETRLEVYAKDCCSGLFCWLAKLWLPHVVFTGWCECGVPLLRMQGRDIHQCHALPLGLVLQ